jgi:hypothetical protein
LPFESNVCARKTSRPIGADTPSVQVNPFVPDVQYDCAVVSANVCGDELVLVPDVCSRVKVIDVVPEPMVWLLRIAEPVVVFGTVIENEARRYPAGSELGAAVAVPVVPLPELGVVVSANLANCRRRLHRKRRGRRR